MKRAFDFSAAGDMENAHAIFERVLRMQPNNANALVQLGMRDMTSLAPPVQETAFRRLERSFDADVVPMPVPVDSFQGYTLAMLVGTDLAPDLGGHVVLIEEVAEYLYAVDRMLFHVTQHLKGIAGLRLGRISDVPENDRPFGTDEVAIVEDWCARSGIPYLGRADIGHDAANKIVPFGLEARGPRA